MDATRLAEELSPQPGALWPRGRLAIPLTPPWGGQARTGGQQFAENSAPVKSPGRPAPVQAG